MSLESPLNAVPVAGQPVGCVNAFAVDTRCAVPYQPGRLITQVRFDKEKLKCYFCCRTAPFCCAAERMTELTTMNVYTNAIVVTQPLIGPYSNCCPNCCCLKHNGAQQFFDGYGFKGDAHKADCCSPFPYFCPHCFGVCGDVLALRGGACELCEMYATMSYLPSWCCCCQSAHMMYGLAEGEAGRVAALINNAKQTFRNGNFERDANFIAATQPAMPVMMMQQAMQPAMQPAMQKQM